MLTRGGLVAAPSLCHTAGTQLSEHFWAEECSSLSVLLCASVTRAEKFSSGAQLHGVVLGKELKLMGRIKAQIRRGSSSRSHQGVLPRDSGAWWWCWESWQWGRTGRGALSSLGRCCAHCVQGFCKLGLCSPPSTAAVWCSLGLDEPLCLYQPARVWGH